MASNLGHQWEVLAFDQSFMSVDILHSIGREETFYRDLVRDIALKTKWRRSMVPVGRE